ncbi:hypothetical protein [Propionicicella superfundia]|uniref:hypothetical protein n=1 Tax=Propionicicella superfundia TaxID=348582 RepID=UPI00040BE2DA|nr:hypothetical protein [Propionicicella superfundia]
MRARLGGLMLLVSLVTWAVASVAATPVAHAATVAVENLRLSVTDTDGNPITGQLSQDDRLRLQATFDLPDDLAAGDVYVIEFPEVLQGVSASTPILSPDGEEIGVCAVSAASATCTLGDFVTGRDGFKDFYFWLTLAASTTTTQEQVPFTIGGEIRYVDLPGTGGIGVTGDGDGSLPEGVQKDGWQYSADTSQVQWRIIADVTGRSDFALTDTFGSGMTYTADSVTAYVWSGTADEWASAGSSGAGFEPIEVEATPSSDGSEISISGSIPSGSNVLVLSYLAETPPGVQEGDVLTNSVTGTLGEASARITYSVMAGAGGNGVLTPPRTPVVQDEPVPSEAVPTPSETVPTPSETVATPTVTVATPSVTVATPTPTTPGDVLADTGAQGGIAAILAALLLVAGTATVALHRRR